MSERSYVKNIVKHLRLLGAHVQRIEDSSSVGIPDIYFRHKESGIWIEVKEIEEFPKRKQTCVKINHFTEEQKIWLLQETKSGGRALLTVRVVKPEQHFIFDAYNAQNIGKMTALDWHVYALFGCNGSMDWAEWFEYVKGVNHG